MCRLHCGASWIDEEVKQVDAYLEIADAINNDISKIIHAALSGLELRYRTIDGFVRWGLVEKEIHKAVIYNLTADGGSQCDSETTPRRAATGRNRR